MVTTKDWDLHEHLSSSTDYEAQYERIRRRTEAFIKTLVKEELEPLMGKMCEESLDEGEIDEVVIHAIYEDDRQYHINRLLHCVINDVIDARSDK